MGRHHVRIGVGLAALTLGISVTFGAAFAQFNSYYPNDRRLDDNGSVYEPGPGPSASTRLPAQREQLINYAPQTSRTLRQYWPNDRRLDDNGSVDEPGPAH